GSRQEISLGVSGPLKADLQGAADAGRAKVLYVRRLGVGEAHDGGEGRAVVPLVRDPAGGLALGIVGLDRDLRGESAVRRAVMVAAIAGADPGGLDVGVR